MEKKKPAAEEDKVKDGRWRGNLPLEKIRQREEGCQGERKRDKRVRGTRLGLGYGITGVNEEEEIGREYAAQPSS